MPDPAQPSLPKAALRTGLRIAALIGFAMLVHELMELGRARLSDSNLSWAMPGFTLALLLLYALLIALPFVPGIEIGLSLLVVSGADVAPAVWIATTLGLSLAYMAGCKVPYRWLHRVFWDLRLTGACRLLEKFERMPVQRRAALLQSWLPTRLAPMLVRYRYLALAVLINIPGNAVIGGGGGIALMTGMSGLFRPPLAMATIALATAPVPLAVWLLGWQVPAL